VSVAIGYFCDLLDGGLAVALSADPMIDVVARGVHRASLARVLERKALPAVAILDERVARPAALSQLKDEAPDIGILVLVREATPARRAQIGTSRAICVELDISVGDLIATIHMAAEGVRMLPQLTRREREVLKYIGEHYTHNEIAQKLQISVETARTHSASIRRKLGVRRNRELAGIVFTDVDT
jgi:DNA-binding CsgD family transcriptional regulator